eukprot:SAG31_NODE_898_length_11146_cov_25.421472_5_plen_437_part_00
MEGDRGRGRSTPRTRTRAQRASRSRDSDREAPEPASERSGRGRPQQLEGAAVGGRNEDAEAAEGAESSGTNEPEDAGSEDSTRTANEEGDQGSGEEEEEREEEERDEEEAEEEEDRGAGGAAGRRRAERRAAIEADERQEEREIQRARQRRRQNRRERGDSARDAILLADSDEEFDRAERRDRAAGSRPRARRKEDWGKFSSEEDDADDEGYSVPYYPVSKYARPERLFRRQDVGRVEEVNLFQVGEYEQSIPCFSDLTPACQFELEYLYPVTVRINDILREMAHTERDEPGRIPAAIGRELRQCYELLEERVDGQLERAKCAGGRSSEGFTIDAALALMLELRDARMEGELGAGAFGRAKQETAKRVRLARAKLRAAAQASKAESRGRRPRPRWKRQQPQDDKSSSEEEKEKGKPQGKGGKGKEKGRRWGDGKKP